MAQEHKQVHEAHSFCKYCKEKISPAAQVCKHCGRDQRKWINKLQYLATITAFIMVLIVAVQAYIGYQQNELSKAQTDEAKKKRIEAEEVLKRAETSAKHVFAITSTNSHNAKVKADDVLASSKEESKKAVKRSIETLQIAETNANKAKLMTDTVKSDIKRTEAAVHKQLLRSDDLLTKARNEFERINNNIRQLKTETANELTILKNRNQLIALTDRATTNGDRAAFEKLRGLYQLSQQGTAEFTAAFSEFMKVKSFYVTANRFNHGDLQYKDEAGKLLINKDIPTDILISTLSTSNDIISRVKAARLLGSVKEKKVAEALIKAINNDSNLDVLKAAIASFNQITETKNIDILDTYPVNDWFSQNKDKMPLLK